jgi:hypothetical protein
VLTGVKISVKRKLQKLIGFPKGSPRYWAALKSLCVGAPTLLLTYIRWPDANMVSEWPLHNWLNEIFKSYWYVLVGVASLPIAISFVFDVFSEACSQLTDRQRLNSASFSTVLAAINEIVTNKQRRISDESAKLCAGGALKCAAFDLITQPQVQISRIIESLGFSIRTLTEDESIRIVLCEVKDGRCINYEIYPRSQPVRPELLNEHFGQTFLARVASRNQTLMISDLESRLGRKSTKKETPYWHDPELQTPTGSIVGFPLVDVSHNVVVYALSIKSDRPTAMGPEFVKKYKMVIEMFATRVLFEHTLLCLKNSTLAPCPIAK